MYGGIRRSSLSRRDQEERLSLTRFRIGRVRRTTLGRNRSRLLRRRCHGVASDEGLARKITRTCRCATRSRHKGTDSCLDHTVQDLRRTTSFSRGKDRLCSRVIRVSDLLGSFGQSLTRCTGDFRCSRRRFSRIRSHLGRIGRLGTGCKGAIDSVLTCYRRGERELSRLRSCSSFVRRLLRGRGGTRGRVRGTTVRLRRIHRRGTIGFTRRVIRRVSRLGFLSTHFRVHLARTGDCSTRKGSSTRFCLSIGPKRPIHPLKSITSKKRLSHVVLTVGAMLTSRRSAPALVFSRVSDKVSKVATNHINRELRLVKGDHRIVYVARLSRVTTTTSIRFYVRGRTRSGSIEARVRELSRRSSITRLTELLNKTGMASKVVSDTERVGRLTGERGWCRYRGGGVRACWRRVWATSTLGVYGEKI